MQIRKETEEKPKRQFLEHLEGAQAKGVEDGIDPWLRHEEGKGVEERACGGEEGAAAALGIVDGSGARSSGGAVVARAHARCVSGRWRAAWRGGAELRRRRRR